MDAPLSPQAQIGHYHVYVSNLDQSRHFYHHQLGFDDMGLARSFKMGMVSAGGYHHHIGYNTWQGEGAPPAPPDALGLKALGFVLPTPDAWQRFLARLQEIGIAYNETDEGVLIHDPSQNTLLFSAAVSSPRVYGVNA